MKRWKVLTGALTAGALTVGLAATPAAAATEVGPGVCTDQGFRLTAVAWYNDAIHPGVRTWNSFSFIVEGGRHLSGDNNVNIRVYEYGSLKWSYSSPDNVRFDRSVQIGNPNGFVRTGKARGSVTITVQGIFDVFMHQDTACTVVFNI